MEDAFIRVVSDDVVARFLRPDFILAHVETTMRGIGKGTIENGSKAFLHLDDPHGLRTFIAMPGALTDEAVCGVKWVGTIAGNSKKGLPRAPATIILTDSLTGQRLAIVEATGITAWRTAAAAVVTAKHCAQQEVRKVAMVGFGAIGKAAAQLVDRALRPERIEVWSKYGEAEGTTVSDVGSHTQAELVAVAEISNAVQDAEIVITATGLTHDAPFLWAEMLQEPVCVCALGSYQELGADVFAGASAILVDDWEACSHRGSLGPLARSGRVCRSDIKAEICDIIAAGGLKPSGGGTRVVACLCGLGALDIAIAHAIHKELGGITHSS